MEIVALVDDYVFGFVCARPSPSLETREEEAEPGWMQAVFDYMRGAARDRRLPQHRAHRSRPTARRAASDEDLARMALDEGRFERGLERLLDGIEGVAAQAASWKMTPSVVRRPERTVATPWRMVAR